MNPVSDAFLYAVAMVLPLVGWVLSLPRVWHPIREAMRPHAVRLWERFAARDEPDELLVHAWAVERLHRLEQHQSRVSRLIADDAWMTATRQFANRLAHRRLLRDIREAQDRVRATIPSGATAEPYVPPTAWEPPPPVVWRPTVEILELGPRRRW